MIEDKQKCKRFDVCSAALCPLDPHPRRYWYSDTEVCGLKTVPEWVKTQRKIVNVNPSPHYFYTQKMLESIKRITPDIVGLDCIGYSKTKENEWFHDRENRHGEKSTGDKAGLTCVNSSGAGL